MEKIYPEKVIIAGDKIFNALCEDEIFADYTLKEREAAKAILFDDLTEKFINDKFNGDVPIYDEEEFETLLNKIIINSLLEMMEADGLLNSYEDEETEKVYFLTEKGTQEAESSFDRLFPKN